MCPLKLKNNNPIITDEGLLAELDDKGNPTVAYGWQPDTLWGTSPLWQANLTANQTLQTANYNYLITDYLGTPQLAINSQGQQTWKALSDAFGNSVTDTNNQTTINLRFPGQYYDQETGLHYNYFIDYNPKMGRYIQSDFIWLKGGTNTFVYAGGKLTRLIDSEGLQATNMPQCYWWGCIIPLPKPLPPGSGIGSGDPTTGLPPYPSSSKSPFDFDFCRDVLLPVVLPIIPHIMPAKDKGKSSQKDSEVDKEVQEVMLQARLKGEKLSKCEALAQLVASIIFSPQRVKGTEKDYKYRHSSKLK